VAARAAGRFWGGAMSRAYLFIGHGTRRQHGVDEFLRFVDAVCAELSPETALSGHAFLEIQPPDIAAGIHSLVERGAMTIVCVPLFLFSAGHIQDDIPWEIQRVKERHPQVSIVTLEPFGEERSLYTVVRSRLQEVPPGQSGTCGVLFLGRGNKDVTAQTAFAEIAKEMVTALNEEHRSRTDGSFAMEIGPTAVGYLAGSGMAMEKALDDLVQQGAEDIVILPYLWFSGWLTDTLPDRVEKWLKGLSPQKNIRIRIAHHLGLHPSFVHLVAERIRAHEELA
jgi:sirohydrochlorin ferrochelatase